jgi:hypothetical protein
MYAEKTERLSLKAGGNVTDATKAFGIKMDKP